MFGLKKKKKTPQGKMVWMIQDPAKKLYLGVCGKDLVHLKDPTACFRFSDIDAASIFIYWLVQTGKIKEGSHRAVYAFIGEKDGK